MSDEENFPEEIREITLDGQDEVSFTDLDNELSHNVREACCYYLEQTPELANQLTHYMGNLNPNGDLSCLTNSIKNIQEAMLFLVDADKNVKYNCIDKYFRFRHNLLHNISMECLSLPLRETDEKFCEIFPFMTSMRTPDRIEVFEKTVIIIETTATGDVKKSFISKGKINEGFKSKYEKEINELMNFGYQVEYFVLIFDIKDPMNSDYQNDLKKLASLFNKNIDKSIMNKLDILRCTFCMNSAIINKKYSDELTNLLTERFDLIKPELENIDFLMVEGEKSYPNYERVSVSTQTYSKITNAWPILGKILDRSFLTSNVNVRPVLDLSVNRFSFIKSRDGISFDDMMTILETNNKPAFSRLLMLTFEKKPVSFERADLEFFETVRPTVTDFEIKDLMLTQYKHPNSLNYRLKSQLNDYSHLIRVEFYKNKKHILEVEDYEDKLIEGLSCVYQSIDSKEKLVDFYSKLDKKPFSSFEVNPDLIEKAVQNYNKEMFHLNNPEEMEMYVRYQKSPFLLPLSDGNHLHYCDYRNTPVVALEVMALMKKGDFTNQIFCQMKAPNFSWGSRHRNSTEEEQILLKELKEVQFELYQLQIKARKETGYGKLPKLKEIIGSDDLKTRLSDCNIKLNKLRGPNKSNLSQIRISTKRNSVFYKAFQTEMEHYRTKRSSAIKKGVGLIDNLALELSFQDLKLSMVSPVEEICPDELYLDEFSSDTPFLEQLKSDYLKNFRTKYNFLKNTSLYSSCAFVSRLCHSLSYYSQSPIGSNYISVDNLGYSNVILMVKGGKKIFKTKKSKLFRLMYPIHTCIKDWYDSPDFDNSNTLACFEGITYLLTPWHSLDEVILNDGLTFLHRCMSFLMLSHEDRIEPCFDKTYFNVMLAFHARRKTEELLHNTRYVCVNSIAIYSRIDIMLPELAGFNYDFFQAFIRGCISKNFLNFSLKLLNYNNMEKVNSNYFIEENFKSLFDQSPIDNLEDLTMTIYSTFLMSKSPTNQQMEQLRNLRNMFKTKVMHEAESSNDVKEQYEKNAKVLKGDIIDYWNNLFSSDFNFDPCYCNLLGKFAGDYMNTIVPKTDFNSKWNSIVNSCWDGFANTKGLRSMDDDKFFNRKGYYVVYEEILRKTDILENIKSLLLSDEDDFAKRKKLNKLNLTYKQEMGCKNMKQAIFHVVDKKQRGGSREIFVMDLQTKINQQVIEKSLAYLCKKVPNEAISVPSNKRLQHIHANVFEKFSKRDLNDYNATLDCRKWAPHSVINKFIDFVLGMSGYLPDTFVTHFLCFFSKMFTKRIYTRDTMRTIIESNENTKDFSRRYLIEDEKKKGSYMEMSYSWVMGIFNYLSSFMHVMNQLHASHIIRKVSSRTDEESVYYHMNAHSDDSGGKIQAKDKLSLSKSFFIYELLLKSCNHMLSDKKCNISNRYFEFLSVLYISNNLLSLITKISGSFNFHPTDTGYCGDVNECYSKCIEMISMGATFEQAYISLKISSHLIYRFYFNKNPTKWDMLMPPQLLGIPDCHPILALICGSDSDVIRLMMVNEDNLQKFLHLSKMVTNSNDLSEDVIKSIKAQPRIRKSQELKTQSECLDMTVFNEDQKWILKNLTVDNTGLRLMKYGIMLNDLKFVASLIDETITRRISRAYYFRSAKVVNFPWGCFTYKEAKIAIELFLFDIPQEDLSEEIIDAINSAKQDFELVKDSYKNNIGTYKLMNYEIINFLKNTRNIHYTENDVVQNRKTCKPIHINIQKTGLPTSSNFDPAQLCIWISFPQYRWLIDLGDDYKNKTDQLTDFLCRHEVDITEVDANWLYNLLQKLKQKYVKEYFIYSNMPSEMRDISSYHDLLTFLSHNSFKNKQILGVTSPLGTLVSQPLPVIFKKLLDNESLQVLTFLNFVFSLVMDFSLFQQVSELNINSTYLGCLSTKLYDLMHELYTKWELKGETASLIVPHIKSLIMFMDGELNSAPWLVDTFYYCFTKNQKLIGNVWLGKGNLVINSPRFKLELTLLNSRVEEVTCNKKNLTLNNMELTYINSVLMNANLPRLEDHFTHIDYYNWEKHSIGLGVDGMVCIDQVRNLKLAFPIFNFKIYMDHKVLNPGICSVSINRNFSYNFTCENELYGDQKYTVNVLKVQSSDTLDLITKLYDNERNQRIIEGRGEYFHKFLKTFIGTVSNVEFKVELTQFYDLLQSTRTYSMLCELVKGDLLSKNSLKYRKHIYPGQHGGLLAAMIDYKSINPIFDFEPDNVLSPEFMMLKSSQPDSFMSNLITNVKQKYSMLYSNLQKEVIRSDLLKLANIMDKDKYEKRLLSILTSWGYIGVMGSINELMFVKKSENYSGIRFNCENPLMIKINKDTLKHVLKSIYQAAQKFNFFGDQVDGLTHLVCNNLKDLANVLISYIHTHVLSSYKESYNPLMHTSVEFLKISETMNLLLRNDDFCSELSRNFEENTMTSLLPVSLEEKNNILIMLQTLVISCTSSIKVHQNLNFDIKVQHSHDLIRPFNLTREFLEDTGFDFNIRAAFHHGYISRTRYSKLNKHEVLKFSGDYYDINFLKGEYSKNCLPFHKSLFLQFPIRDEFFDEDEEDFDEFEEVVMELFTEEPDDESYSDLIERAYKGEYCRKSKVNKSGVLIDCNRIDVNTFLMPQFQGDYSKLNFIRNAGNTILILTNIIIPDLIEYDGKFVETFHACNDAWENMSLTDPSCTIYYVIDTQQINIKFWEKALACHHFPRIYIRELEARNPTNTIIDENGDKKYVRKYMDLESKLELLEVAEKTEIEEEEIEIEEVMKTTEENFRELGFDEDLIKLISLNKKKISGTGGKNIKDLEEFFTVVFRKIKESKNLVEISKYKIEKTTENILSNLKDVTQATQIFEVAKVFTIGPPIKTARLNRSLKDNFLRAEINSLAPNIMEYILSNRLAVSEKVKVEFNKHIRAMKAYISQSKVDKDKKMALLDLSCLIINDANIDDDSRYNQDDLFKIIMSNLTNFIVTDEDDESYDFTDTYKKEPRRGFLYYDW